MRRTNTRQLLVGLWVLVLATLVYVIERPPGETILPASLSLFAFAPSPFGAGGPSLPTFGHVLAFSLLTMGTLGGRTVAVAVCAGWFLLNTAFELGQQPDIAHWLVPFIPQWFDSIPILARTRGYFRYGIFDPVDVIAAALGALGAYFVIQRTGSVSHE